MVLYDHDRLATLAVCQVFPISTIQPRRHQRRFPGEQQTASRSRKLLLRTIRRQVRLRISNRLRAIRRTSIPWLRRRKARPKGIVAMLLINLSRFQTNTRGSNDGSSQFHLLCSRR